MMLLDLNQVMLSNLMVQIGNHTNAEIQEGMVRHMVLNSIRMYNSRHRKEYGEMVIACDAGNGWRKNIFPYYKARRKNKKNTELNWSQIFQCLDTIRSELKVYLPYRVVHVDTAEADDVIATLVHNIRSEPILILSGDKDFKQLQLFPNVKQYDPVHKKFLVEEDPTLFLRMHIIKGDSGDDVPNILSADDTFVSPTGRQSPMTAKRMEMFLSTPLDALDPEVRKNYARNQAMIDLNRIPDDVKSSIMTEYEAQAGKGRSQLMAYFTSRRLKNLIGYMGDF